MSYLAKLLGAALVTAVTYGMIGVVGVFLEWRFAISLGVGVAYYLWGRQLWDWLDEITDF